MRNILFIALGGALGAVLRYLISKTMSSFFPAFDFPLGTLFVNILGSFFLSWVLFANLYKISINPEIILLFCTGFLGAFTTFSSLMYEIFYLFQKSLIHAFFYFFISVTGGFFAIFLGYFLAKK